MSNYFAALKSVVATEELRPYRIAGVKIGIAIHSFNPLVDVVLALLKERDGERNEEVRAIAVRLLESINRAMPE